MTNSTLTIMPRSPVKRAPVELTLEQRDDVLAFKKQAEQHSGFLMHPVPQFVRQENPYPNDGEPAQHWLLVEEASRMQEEWRGLVAAIGSAFGGVGILRPGRRADSPAATAVQDSAIILRDLNAAHRPLKILQGRFSQTRSARAAEPERLDGFFNLLADDAVCSLHGGAALEGGDVVKIGRRLFVREPDNLGRINNAGFAGLENFAQQLGYELMPVKLRGERHLTHACTWAGSRVGLDGLARDLVVFDSSVVQNAEIFERVGLDCVDISGEDPQRFAANVLPVNGHLIIQRECPILKERLLAAGFKHAELLEVEWSAMAQAEIGFTCCVLPIPGQSV